MTEGPCHFCGRPFDATFTITGEGWGCRGCADSWRQNAEMNASPLRLAASALRGDSVPSNMASPSGVADLRKTTPRLAIVVGGVMALLSAVAIEARTSSTLTLLVGVVIVWILVTALVLLVSPWLR